MAVGQLAYLSLKERYRWQASSHIFDRVYPEADDRHMAILLIAVHDRAVFGMQSNLWELACLRWRWVSWHICH
jgi:hypothetical protein